MRPLYVDSIAIVSNDTTIHSVDNGVSAGGLITVVSVCSAATVRLLLWAVLQVLVSITSATGITSHSSIPNSDSSAGLAMISMARI